MKISNHDLKKILDVLSIPYREMESPVLDESWRKGVMNHIRSMGPQRFHNGFEKQFHRLAWRLIPVVCLMIVILGFVLMKIDYFPEYEMARQFIEDPTGYMVTKFLGV